MMKKLVGNPYKEKTGNGNYASSFNHTGNNGYWRSISENEAGEAYYRFLLHESNGAGWNKGGKKLLLSVRCVED